MGCPLQHPHGDASEATSSPEHTQRRLVPSKLHLQHRISRRSPDGGTATKALPQGGRNTLWQRHVFHPRQHGAHPVPHASRSGSAALTHRVPRGKAAPSLCPARGLLRHWRVSTERPPRPGTCAWCRKTGAAGICSSLLNKLSPIIALALESKASGVMNNCYF